jgi:uncharacterized protein involved in exopolysaccharide biosynthesis
MLVLLATAALIMLRPEKFDATMTLLVKRERADNVVNPDASAQTINPRGEVTEAELNSVAELLKGRDLLEAVALSTGLAQASMTASTSQTGILEGVGAKLGLTESAPAAPVPAAAARSLTPEQQTVALARVVRRLGSDLSVVPIKRTTLINVGYSSTDPEMAARVLNELGKLYLEKHARINRPVGAYDFFSEQTERLRREMTTAEDSLLGFGRTEGVVSADMERDDALKQLTGFEAQLQDTRAERAAANRRLDELNALADRTPERMTTQMRTLANPGLIAALKDKVLGLELRRTEMLDKFLPTYPPVVQLEEQLAQAREALEAAQEQPATEETTDRNPISEWLKNEIAKVSAEAEAAAAKEASIQQSIRFYQVKARDLDDKSAVQNELKRSLKSAEDNYLLYLQKQEEARISDALDQARISNVAIAEPAKVPVLPAGGGTVVAAGGVLAALLLGLAATYIRHYTSPHLQTPDDVEEVLNVPVLASLSGRR